MVKMTTPACRKGRQSDQPAPWLIGHELVLGKLGERKSLLNVPVTTFFNASLEMRRVCDHIRKSQSQTVSHFFCSASLICGLGSFVVEICNSERGHP